MKLKNRKNKNYNIEHKENHNIKDDIIRDCGFENKTFYDGNIAVKIMSLKTYHKKPLILCLPDDEFDGVLTSYKLTLIKKSFS